MGKSRRRHDGKERIGHTRPISESKRRIPEGGPGWRLCPPFRTPRTSTGCDESDCASYLPAARSARLGGPDAASPPFESVGRAPPRSESRGRADDPRRDPGGVGLDPDGLAWNSREHPASRCSELSAGSLRSGKRRSVHSGLSRRLVGGRQLGRDEHDRLDESELWI